MKSIPGVVAVVVDVDVAVDVDAEAEVTNSPISPDSRTISSWERSRSSRAGSGRADLPVNSSTNETRRDDPSECDDDFRPLDVTRTECSGRLWLDSRLGPILQIRL
jgi:hypothetical protein